MFLGAMDLLSAGKAKPRTPRSEFTPTVKPGHFNQAGISVLDFQIPFSINQTAILVVPRFEFFEFFLREPSSPPQGGFVALAEKVKSRNPVFSVHSTNTPPAPLPGFTVSSPSPYPVATGKAAILPTIASNSRLVR